MNNCIDSFARGATRRRVITVFAAGAMMPAAAAFAGDCDIAEPIVIFAEGDAAPETDGAFQNFDRPNLSEDGSIAFAGDLDTATSTDDVVYVGLQLVAREGQPASASGGGIYQSFEFFETGRQVNIDGDVVYITTLTNVPSTENRAVYRNLELIAQEGDTLLEIPGRLISDFGFAGIADDGRVGYLADLDGGTADDSVIVFDGDVIFREGDPAPLLDGATFDGNFDEIQWNGNGDFVVEANTSGPGSEDMKVYRYRNDGKSTMIDIVASEGQAVDANTGPDFLELILQTSIAENGMWGLRGNLGVAPSEADAVILTETGFYAQQGDPVPELPGVVLGNFNAVDINSNGDVLYLADLEGATPAGVDEGLFLNGCLVITDGVQAPGLPDGTLLSDIGFEDCYINDAGEIVFQSGYTGGDGLFFIPGPGPEPCAGDVSGDGGVVDFADLLIVLSNWGPCPGGGDPCPGDASGDGGVVGFDDLLVVLAAWGPCPF